MELDQTMSGEQASRAFNRRELRLVGPFDSREKSMDEPLVRPSILFIA